MGYILHRTGTCVQAPVENFFFSPQFIPVWGTEFIMQTNPGKRLQATPAIANIGENDEYFL
jgi:hypothetical protein